jgi:tRNA(fMet)-specific endonuclease VapC
MHLKYLLDTNICIYIAKQKPEAVMKRFVKLEVGELAMSIITYGELLYGAKKSHFQDQAHKKLIELTTLIPALPLNNDVAEHYGDIRANLEKMGKLIGNDDLWIASHARALKAILVTNNFKEFKRVPHLKIENWV